VNYFIYKWIEDQFNTDPSKEHVQVDKPNPMRYTEDGKYIVMPDGSTKLSMKWLHEQPMYGKRQ